MCARFLYLWALFLFGLLHVIAGVKINRLQVPEVIRHGAPVILDCDFTLEEKDEDLVVKWYFTKNKTLVYQWIPGSRKRPQDLGILKGRLNLEYAASQDANSVHRALHILEPGPDLSGDYTCSVSTFQSEDIQTKNMLVFVPEKSLLLRRIAADEDFVRVQCKAEGVFPKPDMVLRSVQRETTETEVKVHERGHLYDITATTTLPALMHPEEFVCDLRIPQANYTKQKETVIIPGESDSGFSFTGLWKFGSAGNAFCCLWWLNLAPCFLLWHNLRRKSIDSRG